MTDLQTRRKKNLRALIKQWEGPTNLARKLKYRGPSYLSQMVGPNKPITEKTARAIEVTLELPNGWMDADHTAQDGQVGKVDTSLISRVMLAVGAVLEGSDALSSAKLAGLVSLCYEHAAEHGGQVDDDYIRRLVSLINMR